MATRKVRIELDEELVRRARDRVEASARSDSDVISDAVTAYIGVSALQDAQAQGTLTEQDADQLAVDEVRGYRGSRGRAA